MTGFGRGVCADGKRQVTTEVRTVNHRYADISVRMPRRYSFAEDSIKNVVKTIVKRGKADLFITVEHITQDDINIKLNEMAAEKYYESLKALREKFMLPGDISVQLLASFPDVLKAIPDVEDEAEVTAHLEAAAKLALENLDAMRAAEGAALAEDIVMRGNIIKSLALKIENRTPEIVASYYEKFRERIKELTGSEITISEERIAAEAAVFADKSNVTEELVRLKSHVAQLESIINKSSQPDGRKLDFLVQEMNREANTIGSKANNIEITNMILEVKSEIEKIREQVQNIE